MNGRYSSLLCAALLLSATLLAQDQAPEAANAYGEPTARDRLVVSTLLKLPAANLLDNAKAKESVLRVMFAERGTDRFVELAEKFSVPEAGEELLRLAAAEPESTLGANSARVALKIAPAEKIALALNARDEDAAKLLMSLANAGGAGAETTVLPVVLQEGRSVGVRSAAIAVLGKTKPGAEMLLKLVQDGKLTADLNFAAANVLLTFPEESIKVAAGKHLTLPATADSKPLPPVAALIERSGDAAQGQEVFMKAGTCIKCHKVKGEGKEVGPDLSEIGSKLSKEALYVSILDPSAGISHNYETHTLLLEDGTVISGIVVSNTDSEVELRTAEAIIRKFAKDEIAQMKKQATSIMPAGLQKNLTAENLVDLVEYLTTLKKVGS